MTTDQLKHYHLGGKFKAIYNPVDTSDISDESKSYAGKELIVWQNMIVVPLSGKWEGQHAFNASEIYGWFPEEDIQIIEQIEEYLNNPEALPRYFYRFTYTDHQTILENFGKGYEHVTLPYVVQRDFPFEKHEYVKQLSKPAADKIEFCVYTGQQYQEIEWQSL